MSQKDSNIARDLRLEQEAREIQEAFRNGEISSNQAKSSKMKLINKIKRLQERIEPMEATVTEMMADKTFLQYVVARQNRKLAFMLNTIKEMRAETPKEDAMDIMDELWFRINAFEDEERIAHANRVKQSIREEYGTTGQQDN